MNTLLVRRLKMKTVKRCKKYEDLTLLPAIIADAVCGREYKGEEYSDALRDSRMAERVEALRKKMTQEQVNEFCQLADNRCKRAYECRAPWFEKLLRHSDGGRDQLYVWLSHWLSSYLINPELLKRDKRCPACKRPVATCICERID
jgi:hypothetical protein